MTTPLLSYAEAAERLRIKPDTLQRWVAAGRVPHKKYFNKRVFFTEEHIEEILRTFERGVLAATPAKRRRKR